MADLQYNPLKFPVYVLAKPVGAECNLRCDYCYYLEKAGFHPQSQRMSDELLERFIVQQIEAQPQREVLFTWHGGEPLLAGMDFFRKVVRIQANHSKGRAIDNSLQTNGTLLTDEWCRFLKENNFLVGLSLDGPEHCHDRYRKNIGGRGSFAQTMKGLELLQKHGVEFNILSVVNDYNAQYALEVYRFFKSVGAKYIQFSPVVERINPATGKLLSGMEHLETETNKTEAVENEVAETGKNCETEEKRFNGLTEWSVSPLAYGDFLNTIFDEWVRYDVGETFVTTFDATLAGYVGAAPGTCLYAKTCGHASALDANGDLYACDHYVFPAFQRGNIRQQTIAEMMLAPEQMQFGFDKSDLLTETCHQCSYLQLCHGECPKNRIVTMPDERYPHNYLCPGLKRYFSHTEPLMRFMANELEKQRPPANVKHFMFEKR